MQTILGAGGDIGNELAKALTMYTSQIRLVSRNPKTKINADDELFPADLTDRDQTLKAIEGSEIVYLTAGLLYDHKVWQQKWPVIMRNVIEGCKAHGAKLVFFDNVYMYDKAHIPHMTEQTPINPPSKKGKVRAEIHQMLMDEVNAGQLEALIARCADFYGPDSKNSAILMTVFERLKEGKKAIWFCSDKYKHSMTYTPDAGRATAQLGNSSDAYNQVWHLPTDAQSLTGREWVRLFAKELGVQPRLQIASKFILRIMGWFVPIIRESYEMLYQYDRNYFFDSKKFETRFGWKATPYEEGLKTIVEKAKSTV